MLPTSRNEPSPRASGTSTLGPDWAPEIASAYIDHYIRRGRRLRAEAMAGSVRWLGAALGRVLRATFRIRSSRPQRGDDALSAIAHLLQTPLTSIRSSAEILRDNPDIDPAERKRFVTAVLAEEARLEALVSSMLAASSVERRRSIWRVRMKHLGLDAQARIAGSV